VYTVRATRTRSSGQLRYAPPTRTCTAIVLLGRIARTTYVDAAYYYRPSSVVSRSVTLVSPAKTVEPIEMSFGLRTLVGIMY